MPAGFVFPDPELDAGVGRLKILMSYVLKEGCLGFKIRDFDFDFVDELVDATSKVELIQKVFDHMIVTNCDVLVTLCDLPTRSDSDGLGVVAIAAILFEW